MIRFSSTNFFLKRYPCIVFFAGHCSVPGMLVIARAVTAQDIKFAESTFHIPLNVKNNFMEK